MSYEEDSRTPYRAECACGKGFLRYYTNENVTEGKQAVLYYFKNGKQTLHLYV